MSSVLNDVTKVAGITKSFVYPLLISLFNSTTQIIYSPNCSFKSKTYANLYRKLKGTMRFVLQNSLLIAHLSKYTAVAVIGSSLNYAFSYLF